MVFSAGKRKKSFPEWISQFYRRSATFPRTFQPNVENFIAIHRVFSEFSTFYSRNVENSGNTGKKKRKTWKSGLTYRKNWKTKAKKRGFVRFSRIWIHFAGYPDGKTWNNRKTPGQKLFIRSTLLFDSLIFQREFRAEKRFPEVFPPKNTCTYWVFLFFHNLNRVEPLNNPISISDRMEEPIFQPCCGSVEIEIMQVFNIYCSYLRINYLLPSGPRFQGVDCLFQHFRASS